jgi:error-prone DNA polymerase
MACLRERENMSAYAELAVTTNFSFLRGASKAEELVLRAKELGLLGLGIADRNSVAGVVRAHAMAKTIGFKIVVGARLVFSDGSPDILAYPKDRDAWGRLTRLLTVGKDRAEKGDCILGLPDLLEEVEGLNLIVMPYPRIDSEGLIKVLRRLKGVSPRRSVWLAASLLYRGDDRRRLTKLKDVADSALVPLIAVNDVLYHVPERRPLHDVVTCIREHRTLEEAGTLLEANAERYLKSTEEMTCLFGKASKAIDQTTRFLKRCRFSLDELKPHRYPSEFRAGYTTAQEALVALTKEGAQRRYPAGVPSHVQVTLAKELGVIEELNCAAYFLTVYDIVRFAESKGILCQGRGSAANSLVCYCLGITAVSPERAGLLFERFLSVERREPPDIDVDFEHERREEVIQHVYEHYKRRHAGMTAAVISYRSRSAIRDVGKVFGLSKDIIDVLTSSIWGWSMEGVTTDQARRAGLDSSDPRLGQTLAMAHELLDFPRHLSQHVGGFVISETRLDEIVPIENAAMEDRTVLEWDKEDLDVLEILKVDVLGLGMLSCLRRGLDLLEKNYAIKHTLASIPEDEQAVYDMLSRADSIGVFQVESRAQMSMLPRLKPEKFYDLVIEVAIVRPGPIQGNMVHPYLRRKEKIEKVEIPSPDPRFGDKDELQDVLGRTLGVPLFQEQAMRIAMVAAKFSATEASKLRRSMATFRRTGEVKLFRERFVEGMCERGYPRKFVEDCFKQIEGFGEYGFPESHAASFALLVYASAWIKCHYPDVFLAALLNSQPMGFYATSQLVRDAQEHGVEMRAVDVNHSSWDCLLENSPPPKGNLHSRHSSMRGAILTTHAVRLGLRQIDRFSEQWAKTIESARGAGFDSIRDLWLRTGLPPKALEKLAHADAFNSLGLSRRDALWAVRALQRAGDKDNLPLFARVKMPKLEPDAHLPPMLPGQQVIEDYRHLHLSLKAHPVSFLRADLDARGILRHELLPTVMPGRRVTIGGIVLVRQRPGTGNAIFMTLEDETAIANTIVWPRKFEEYRPVVMGARLISVSGVLQNEKGVIHIVADRFEDLTPLLRRLNEDVSGVKTRSRADMVRSENPDRLRHPRAGDSFVRIVKNQPAIEQMAAVEHAVKVMPKGRNFH